MKNQGQSADRGCGRPAASLGLQARQKQLVSYRVVRSPAVGQMRPLGNVHSANHAPLGKGGRVGRESIPVENGPAQGFSFEADAASRSCGFLRIASEQDGIPDGSGTSFRLKSNLRGGTVRACSNLPLRFHSFKGRFEKGVSEVADFVCTELIAVNGLVLYFQSKRIFPSWTSRVRTPSPAPFLFNKFQWTHRSRSGFQPPLARLNGVERSGRAVGH